MLEKPPPKKPSKVRNKILVMYYALKNTDLKASVKVIIIAILAYALYPFDLVSDLLPFFGFVDDLLIIPLLYRWALAAIPEEVLLDSQKKAGALSQKFCNYSFLAILLIFLWLLIIYM